MLPSRKFLPEMSSVGLHAGGTPLDRLQRDFSGGDNARKATVENFTKMPVSTESIPAVLPTRQSKLATRSAGYGASSSMTITATEKGEAFYNTP